MTDFEKPGARERVLVWMCVIVTINQLGFGSLVPVLPLYAQSFGVPASAIGSTIAIYGLARLLTTMPVARFADSFGRRPALACGGLVSSIGCAWCGWAHTFPEFLAARFVAGAGGGMVLTVGTIVLADISTAERRGRMMATYQGFFLFAFGIGPFPGGLLAERYGLSVPFFVYAVLSIVVGLLTWFAVPETRALGIGSGASTRGSASVWSQLRTLLGHVGFRLVALLSLVSSIVRTGGLFAVVPLIGAGKLGLTPGQIGSGFALGSVLGLIASYPGGALSDRFGRKPVIVPTTLLTALSMLSFCYAPSYGWFVFGCVVWGIGSAVSGAAPAAYVADTAPPGMNAAAMSGFRMVGDLGYVGGPIALGLLVDIQGAERTMLMVAAMVLVVAVLFGALAPESHSRRR